jgi:hypothetical protein
LEKFFYCRKVVTLHKQPWKQKGLRNVVLGGVGWRDRRAPAAGSVGSGRRVARGSPMLDLRVQSGRRCCRQESLAAPGGGGRRELQFWQARGSAGWQASARARVDRREEAKMVGRLGGSVQRRTRREAAMVVVAEHRPAQAEEGTWLYRQRACRGAHCLCFAAKATPAI